MLLAGGILFVFAWLIGVLGYLNLISNYRAHPERYPDKEGLGRWVGWTMAAGGASFALCGTLVLTGVIGKQALATWGFATGVALAVSALAVVLKFRRCSKAESSQASQPPPRNARRR